MLEVLVIERKRLEFGLIPTVNQPPMRKLALILARTQKRSIAFVCFRLLSLARALLSPCFQLAFISSLYQTG